MPKKEIKVTINDNEFFTNSIIADDIIKYIEPNHTDVVLNMTDNTLVRENNEIYMKYDFNNKKGNLIVKELDKTFDLTIKNIKIIKKENIIEIKYNIDEETFIYRVEVL